MLRHLLELIDLQMVYERKFELGSLFAKSSSEKVNAVDGINLALGGGETISIVGESGSGKTTTGRIVTLQERPTRGSVVYEGQVVNDLRGAALKRYRRNVQMIFLNTYEALDPRFTIRDSLREPLDLHGNVERHERDGRVEEVLSNVGLRPASAFSDRYPSGLSGGQLQRVAIARALILEPKIVVADEPVSMLDVSVRAEVMNLMLALQQRLGVSYLYITHDLAVARYMGNRIAVMYLGAIVEEGPTEDVIQSGAHPYTRLLVAAVPEYRQGLRREAPVARARIVSSGGVSAQGCRFQNRCPIAADICATVKPPKFKVARDRTSECHFAAEVADRGLSGATELRGTSGLR